MELTELQRDVLLEAFNIGMGRAAATLSSMAHQEIELSIPRIEIIKQGDSLNHVDPDQPLAAISQAFDGSFGRAVSILMFPQDKSYELVKLLLGEEAPRDSIADLEQDAMTEVGNILLNSLIASLANIARESFRIALPEFKRSRWANLNQSSLPQSQKSDDDPSTLLVLIDFRLSRASVQGYLAVFLEASSLHSLLRGLGGDGLL